MYPIPPFTTLLEESWNEYLRRAGTLIKFILWTIPILLLMCAGSIMVFGGTIGTLLGTAIIPHRFTLITNPYFICAGVLLLISGLILYAWFDLALTWLIVKPESEKTGVWRATRPRLLPYIGFIIAVCGLIGGGFFFLFIPGIIFSVIFAFAQYYFVLEEGIKGSLKKSERLVQGRWWKIALYLAGSFLCMWIPGKMLILAARQISSPAGLVVTILFEIALFFVGMPWKMIFENNLRVHAERASIDAHVISAE